MYNPFRQKRKVLTALKEIKESGVTLECKKCGHKLPKEKFAETAYVCPECGYHMNVTSPYRIRILIDAGSFREICSNIKADNPLDFPGYGEKLAETTEKTGISEAVICGTGTIDGMKACFCFMDNRFFMGSMGTAVGEKITRSFEYATKHKLPMIVFCTSGGARMQEGILSLFQMAKTSAAVKNHGDSGQLFVSVMTHPTTGGVTASFASLGDIILAEPGALIGFAGHRVIKQTIGQSLPEGFQRAEYLMEHGFVDKICDRRDMKRTLSLILRLHKGDRK